MISSALALYYHPDKLEFDSLFQLSKAIGVSKGIISLWENGEREPGMNSLILLAQFFNVSIDYLVGLED